MAPGHDSKTSGCELPPRRRRTAHAERRACPAHPCGMRAPGTGHRVRMAPTGPPCTLLARATDVPGTARFTRTHTQFDTRLSGLSGLSPQLPHTGRHRSCPCPHDCACRNSSHEGLHATAPSLSSNQKQSAAISSHQQPSYATLTCPRRRRLSPTVDHVQSSAIKRNQVQSGAITCPRRRRLSPTRSGPCACPSSR